MFLIGLSFIANIVITAAVSLGIWRNHPGMTEIYGPDAPARRILACIYTTIGLISLYGFIQMCLGNTETARTIGFTLFPLQIIYKLMTARALWIMHPVVLANLGVAALLALTLLGAV
ncbi:hypothetical protein Z946_1277 [Sulfitobacter noctilucicola]|uniref:Uncharacterized protein n=1 Tax=Sulfitobacter noctilucicola TaxID=1342301 RepID=A0A7W6Q2Z6_9RHOB|nr:hypothetical protein [Sulfitobacter noctilucicola]KIN62419.1 hypothetical protein Z946_1277 [Sulfitobacter noctilucicola]MBB4173048.1 hypothetical protein [Sulfitobacter noctilucicola]